MTNEAGKTFAAEELEAANRETAAEVARVSFYLDANPDLPEQARYNVVMDAQRRCWQRTTQALLAGILAMRGAGP